MVLGHYRAVAVCREPHANGANRAWAAPRFAGDQARLEPESPELLCVALPLLGNLHA